MSKSGNWLIASTQGADHTMYAAMRKMGIPLTPEQQACQEKLEKMYPPGVATDAEDKHSP